MVGATGNTFTSLKKELEDAPARHREIIQAIDSAFI